METGVASGYSTTMILAAMERNGLGRLYSIDLPLPEVRLLPEDQQTG